jgi:DNA-binding transcriptional regulator YdaS (Cro superfamily)
MSETPEQALDIAIAAAGGFTRLGRMLGISGEAIMQWKRAPAQRVLDIERVTGVAKERLRPDYWAPKEAAE